jgi:formylglycine-generating enzyme required for sulfatase activity
MRAAPGALPLMQFALDDLFQYEKSQGGVIALTLKDYLKRGGLEKALTRHADAEFAKLDDAEKQLARSVFSGLVEIGRGREDTKRTALFDELVPAGADESRVQALVRELADARLITTDEQDGKETVTLAHERLIDAWDWLRRLVDENREAIALQNQINDDAKEWEQHGRDASYLYTGARLATAQEEVEKKKIVLSAAGREFVQAGTTARQAVRQARQRQRRLVSLVGFAFVILLVNIAYEPIRREFLRQQALSLKPVLISKSKAIIGDPRGNLGNTDSLPISDETISAFSIEPYEVTNARYLFCVEASVCSAPIAFRSTFSDSQNANLPVVNVTAIQASQFCEWLGRHLPTEREWERAARGTEGLPWPWGTVTPSPALANLYYDGLPLPDIRAVGSYPNDRSPEVVFDLAGNVGEWTRSPFKLGNDWAGGEEDLPITLVIKGGDIRTNPAFMSNIAYRLESKPFSFDKTIGFRCVEH